MIGTNRGHVRDPTPQLGLIFRGPQWRRALRDCAQADHVFVGEEKIMRASLAGNIHATRSPFRHERNSAAATDMHNMQSAAGFSRQFNRAADRFEFCFHGPRIQIIAHACFAGRELSLRACADHFVRLRVHCDEKVKLSGALHSRAQSLRINRGEIVDPALAHECFDPDHAAIAQGFELIHISGHQPAPKSEVNQ